jgi:6-phosphofructokinase
MRSWAGFAPLITNLISTKLGCKCHWAVPDYLLRSARHIASETDVEQAYAVGRAAVEFALAGRSAVMPAIRRISDAPYRWDVAIEEFRFPGVGQTRSSEPPLWLTPPVTAGAGLIR